MTDHTVDLDISGMTCGGCVGGVTRAIHNVDPAADIDADPPTRKVIVTTTQPGAALVAALAAAGFDATLQQKARTG